MSIGVSVDSFCFDGSRSESRDKCQISGSISQLLNPFYMEDGIDVGVDPL